MASSSLDEKNKNKLHIINEISAPKGTVSQLTFVIFFIASL
jgi:hypothetical protein